MYAKGSFRYLRINNVGPTEPAFIFNTQVLARAGFKKVRGKER